MEKIISAKPNSAVASQPYPLGQITADKRLRFAHPNAFGNFFYPQTLYEIAPHKRLIDQEKLK